MKFYNKKAFRALIINLLLLLFLLVATVPALAKPKLVNPLSPNNSATEAVSLDILFGNILKAALGIVGILSLVFFVWGGFIWMTAGGNQEKVKQGRDTLMWATLGLAAIFASYAILSVVIKALSDKTIRG